MRIRVFISDSDQTLDINHSTLSGSRCEKKRLLPVSEADTDNMKPYVSVFRPIFQTAPDDIREFIQAVKETL